MECNATYTYLRGVNLRKTSAAGDPPAAFGEIPQSFGTPLALLTS